MKPLCLVCGDRHYGHQAHVFATNGVANKPVIHTPKPKERAVSHKSNMANTYRYRDPEKRRWYMRVLMAVKRGKADWWPRRGNALES